MRKNLDNIIIVLYIILWGVADDYRVKHNNIIPSLKNPDGDGAQTTGKSISAISTPS